MADGSNILTIFDFAAGSGMLGEAVRLALDVVGVESAPVGYVEREASAAAAIVAGLEAQGLPRPAMWDDARTFDGRRFRGCVDIFCAGYPCQPFSLAGKRGGESDPRHLWPAVRDAIATTEPSIVFLENVAGHLRLGYGAVERDLRGLGYTAFPGLFTAAEVGAPHDRKRLFILAVSACWRPGDDVQRNGASAQDATDRDSRGTDIDGRDSPMADADWLQRAHASPGQQGGARSDVAGASEALADAELPGGCGPRSGIQEPEQIGTGAGDGNRQLAEPASERREGSEPESITSGPKDVIAKRCVDGLAIANDARPRAGIEGEQGSVAEHGWDRPEYDSERIPVFPPGPGDLESWAVIASMDPTRMPAIESDVRGVADGLAPWSERVRMLGNGVVPLAAAYAFLSLFACACGDE